MAKIFKFTAIVLTAIIVAIILFVVSYVIYVAAQYYRIEDNKVLVVENNQSIVASSDDNFSIMTYNVGFGAYDKDYSFFMDVGVDKETGKKITGKSGTATSYEHVINNINGSIDLINDNIADFVFLQEVDVNGTRSYHVNQYDMFKSKSFSNYSQIYAENFHSAYLMYPLFDNHGLNYAGIATFSKYKVESAVRRSYPVDDGFGKFFDLDRCFSINRVPLSNGKELTLINSHMSAYDEGGVIRHQQLKMLNDVMKAERDKGNYVIVGGDFNHDLIDGGSDFPTGQEYPAWVNKLSNKDLTEGFSIVASENAGTCRAAELPYKKGYNFEVVVDGFIVSDNIEVISINNIDNGYLYSDHNPARMEFRLK